MNYKKEKRLTIIQDNAKVK